MGKEAKTPHYLCGLSPALADKKAHQLVSMEARTVRRNSCAAGSTLIGVLIPVLGTVLLHLYAGALARRLPPGNSMKPLHAIYIPVPSPFPDLEMFIDETVKTYNLDLYSCRPSSSQVESVSTPAPSPLIPPSNGTSYAPPPRPVGNAKGGEGMLQALQTYKELFPQITAILIGTRRTDPHGGESTISAQSLRSYI